MASLKDLRFDITVFFGRLVLALWSRSTRFRVHGGEAFFKLREDRRPVVLAVWHGKLFLTPWFLRRFDLVPLVSPSRDGELITRIVLGWKYRVIRGSGSHPVLKAWGELLRELKSGGGVIMVADGPRGPARVLKPGCVRLAQETGAVLVPFTISARKKKILRSWDSFMVTRPFGRATVVFGEPLTIPPGLRGDALEAERARVEAALRRLDEDADRLSA